MEVYQIFLVIYAAMIATGIWEATIEENRPWDKGKRGWKVEVGKYTLLTAYHFWLFFVSYPLLLVLPWALSGFSVKLLGILLSAYLSGLVVEDVVWFLANPLMGLKCWNPKDAAWYPWIGIGRMQVPLYYVGSLLLAILSWIFLW